MPEKSASRTQKQLAAENKDLRARLDEAEEILRAIRGGEVDALIVSGVGGEQILTFQQVEEALRSSEEKYRSLVEGVNDGFYVSDEAGIFTFANPALAGIYGVETPQALVGRQFLDFVVPEMLQELGETHRRMMQAGHSQAVINSQIMRPDGTRAYIEVKSASILKGDQIIGSRGVVRDVTERKLAEKALRESEEKFRNYIEFAPDGIFIIDDTGRYIDANPSACRILGYSKEEILEMSIRDLLDEESLEDGLSHFKNITEINAARSDLWHKHKDGTKRCLTISAVKLSKTRFLGFCVDITERKQAQQEIEILSRFPSENPNPILRVAQDGKIIYANGASKALLRMWNSTVGEYLPHGWRERVAHAASSGAHTVVDIECGERVYSIMVVPIPDSGYVNFYGRDITERKKAEDELQSARTFLDSIINAIADPVFVKDDQRRFVLVNDALCATVGRPREGLLGEDGDDMFPKDQVAVFRKVDSGVFETGRENVNEEFLSNLSSGEVRTIVTRKTRYIDPSGRRYLVGVIRDITERKQAEEELRQSEARFRILFEQAADVILQLEITSEGIPVIREANNATLKVLGYTRDELVGRPVSFIEDVSDAPKVVKGRRRDILSGTGTVFETRHRCKDGTTRDFECSVTEMHVGSKTFAISVERDVTERSHAVEKIRRQLEHLTAMSTIDRVIAANFNLMVSLSEILTHVTTGLGMDATDILILNSNSKMLEFCVEHGFRSKAVRKGKIRLGEGYAGRAALERRLVQVADLDGEPDNAFANTHWKGEDFVCYYGVPLIAKGQVKGVLEVFHRTALEPDQEWFDFLNALAGQTAIAIENSTLFESLQRSNMDLAMAYDATIEGWSRALDLRDKETEGHTQRVTETTVKLARAFGMSEADLVHVRRGALLHDIGKMGVPDEILHKPGPLTDEEWVAMKKHPTFAYEMLAPIGYLRQALDIPYCHHEKWDGSGYPRGLQGDQIPLVARIFAVVDVWDALRSDRPYRAAWTEEKVREYIRASSGTFFDPQVVDMVLRNLGLLEPFPVRS